MNSKIITHAFKQKLKEILETATETNYITMKTEDDFIEVPTTTFDSEYAVKEIITIIKKLKC